MPRLPSISRNLSARLLVLTVFFVMLAEFLIYAPSIARFRKMFLEESIARAHLAMVAVESLPAKPMDKMLQEELLFYTGTYAIVVNQRDRRMLMVGSEMPPRVDRELNLDDAAFFGLIRDAFETLFQKYNRVLWLKGTLPKNPAIRVEIIFDEDPLRKAMYDYSGRILTLSIVISLFTAGLVFLSLQWLMVRPMLRITQSMVVFRDDPEDQTRAIAPTNRADEIGVAQRELAVMQQEIRAALKQKTRLATLGAAVAKINHDLRNSLATAALASDRLVGSPDPDVKRVANRLYNAIDRAAALCSQTLRYVSDVEPGLNLSRFQLRALVDEVIGQTPPENGPEAGNGVRWDNTVPANLEIEADRDQLFRALSNLAINARSAGARTVTIGAARRDNRISIDIADDGPGLNERARQNLFQPFAGTARDGGTGLGMVIAKDILRAHGGDLAFEATGPEGTRFRLDLADGRA
ncbi:MAG: HAMP domain-containing histidine kinase [Rhodospirillales bacterium]|nr:HAMP domain-containing histidine kinase [Rhodospirillales bacterium]